jgi:hypothetical protein
MIYVLGRWWSSQRNEIANKERIQGWRRIGGDELCSECFKYEGPVEHTDRESRITVSRMFWATSV